MCENNLELNAKLIAHKIVSLPSPVNILQNVARVG